MRERGRQSAGSNVVDVIKFTQDCDRRQAGAGTATTRIRHFSHRSGEFLSCEVIGSTNAEQIGAITHEQSPNLSPVPPCLATTARRWSVDRARHEGLLARRKPLLIFLQGGGGFSERFGDFCSQVPNACPPCNLSNLYRTYCI